MVPYGYRRRRKQFVPDKEEAVVVTRIFEQIENGASWAEIADELNTKGYRLRNGRLWTRRQILAIASRSDLYKHGILRYGSIKSTNEKLILIRGGR